MQNKCVRADGGLLVAEGFPLKVQYTVVLCMLIVHSYDHALLKHEQADPFIIAAACKS